MGEEQKTQTIESTLPPEPPAHLSERAASLWRSIVGEFELHPEALEVLRRACEAGDRADEARAILADEGITFRNRWGEVRPHPAVGIERSSRDAQARLLKQLKFGDEELPQASGAARAMARRSHRPGVRR